MSQNRKSNSNGKIRPQRLHVGLHVFPTKPIVLPVLSRGMTLRETRYRSFFGF